MPAARVAAGGRVLLVVPNLYPAGAEMQLVNLALGLAADGWQVRLACLGEIGDGVDVSELLAAGVGLYALGGRERHVRLLAAARLVRLARWAEVVHCTMWDATLWGRLAAILARRPSAITEHTPGREEHRSVTSGAPRARWIAAHNRWLDRWTGAVVLVADWQRELVEAEGVAPAHTVHIPNGVRLAELRATAAASSLRRADIGVPEDAMVLIHVARLVPQKNHELSLQVAARLREIADVWLVLVGSATEELEARAQAAGARAVCLGARRDVPSLLALADLAILPSRAEAMPMAVIEAIGLGVPVVATRVGDVGSILEQTGAGIVVPPDDPEAFYAACARLVRSDEERAGLRRAAAAAAGSLDASVMAGAYSELFARLRAGEVLASAA